MSPTNLQYEPINGPREVAQVKRGSEERQAQASRSVSKRPRYAWVWPKGQKHQSWRGRWQDIVTGQGPDIYVAVSQNTQHRRKELVSKGRWSMWDVLVESAADDGASTACISCDKRLPDECYGSPKRKHARLDQKIGGGTRWQDAPDNSLKTPTASCDVDGQYWEEQRSWPDPKEW